MMIFDLQLFGGKGGGTTNVQAYEPTDDERRLQKASADYAEAVAPNALWLNDTARNLLANSLGTVQVDFNSLNQAAQDRINNSLNGLTDAYNGNNNEFAAVGEMQRGLYDQIPGITEDYTKATNGIISSNTSAANTTNNTLGNIAKSYGTEAGNTNKTLGNISKSYGTLGTNTQKVLNNISGEYEDATTAANKSLRDLSGQFLANANQSNDRLNGLVGEGNSSAGDANAQLSSLFGKTGDALDRYSGIRDQLIRGILPSNYLKNMSDAVSGAVKRTTGENLNSLANRGVLNSSVTQGVLDNIDKNVTETMANRYLDNINTVNGLLGNQVNDAQSVIGQQAGLIGQGYNTTADNLGRNLNIYNTQTGNTNNALGQQGNLTQQQLGNTNTMLGNQQDIAQQNFANNSSVLGNQGNLAQQQLGNTNNALGQQGNLAQQQFTNTSTTNMNNANLYGQQYNNRMNSVGNQFDMTNQYLQNAFAKNAQNASILNSIINGAPSTITTAAASQEAAQAPATNLWNMSLGLNGANTGALAAAAGKGTTTTTTRGGGGGLFSGLLGGLF